MKDFIAALPKAELHLHIEGSFEPELMFEIAQRNQIEIPYKTIDEVKKAYQFSCLQDFLDIYYAGAGVLIQEKDFYDLAMAYYQKCYENNVIHTEIMFDPQTHTERGIAFETVINGLQKARLDAKEKWGINSLFIMSYLRHLSEESAFETLKQSLPYKDLITSVGLDSSEMGNPPAKFKNVFEASVKEGYIPVAHAGEEGPAEYIWEAIDILKVARIDHGNRCLEDENLVQEIVKRNLALTVCPLSNLELRNTDVMTNHPLKRLLDRDIKATVNSDDPAYFGGYMNANFQAVQEALDLSKEDIITLVKNSFNYSFATDEQKKYYLEKVYEAVADFN
ncbi:adenosine deaminase [Epilithonimonas hungarica]|uniref:Adenine deaminase n=1 Tax=Epilithonimonas hungarica TaxID=454006 RepID=A0A1G7U9T5_9FLAO|nr:adenosine deaminase [Epilithonimonas hungarica]SDG44217.1 adenosine deaminase [Epilithonimonas hungarica]